jgi:hypothetical protein
MTSIGASTPTLATDSFLLLSIIDFNSKTLAFVKINPLLPSNYAANAAS